MCVVLPVPVGQTHLRVLGEPLGVGDPVTEAGEHWDKHPPARISEHLGQVTALAQTEPVLVWTSAEHRGSECL